MLTWEATSFAEENAEMKCQRHEPWWQQRQCCCDHPRCLDGQSAGRFLHHSDYLASSDALLRLSHDLWILLFSTLVLWHVSLFQLRKLSPEMVETLALMQNGAWMGKDYDHGTYLAVDIHGENVDADTSYAYMMSYSIPPPQVHNNSQAVYIQIAWLQDVEHSMRVENDSKDECNTLQMAFHDCP